MAAPIFQQQQPGDPLYLLSYNGVADALAAYYPFQATGGSVSFPDSWNSVPGVYLFFDEAVSSQQVFAEGLRRYLSSPGHANARFLWIGGPNLPVSQWTIEVLSVVGGRSYQRSQLSFGGYLLQIGGGCSITLSATGDDYQFVLAMPQPQTCSFQTASGAYSYPLPAGSIILDYHQVSLGCLLFNLTVGGAGQPDFDTMDVGCRYYFDNAEYPGYLQSLRYPVFGPVGSPVPVFVSLNPCHHFDAALSYFSLYPPGTTPGALASWWRTNMGQPVALTPLATARLVFAVRPATRNASPADLYTLVPMGDFVLSAGGTARNCLMPGISGVEYIDISGVGNQVRFVPGKAAYAPAFRTAPAALSEAVIAEPITAARDTGLTAAASTAWAWFSGAGGQGINYYAQAEDSLLYQLDQAGVLAPYLGYLEVLNGSLPPSTSGAYPAAPYSGIGMDQVKVYHRFEQQILNPVRRQLIETFVQPLPPPQTGDVPGVTPQGLRLDWDASRTTLQSVTIASTGNKEGAVRDGLLQYTDIGGPFRSALLSNQLFLVMTNMTQFLGSASVNYKLSRRSMLALSRNGVPAALLCKLRASPSLEGRLYSDLAAYTSALLTKITQAELDQYKDKLLQYGAYSFVEIGGTTFYELTTATLRSINACGANSSIPDQLVTQLVGAATVADQKFESYDGFQAAVEAVIGTANWALYQVLLTEYARTAAGSWTFDCSPYIWANPTGKDNPGPEDPNTIVIFKYAGSSLESLAADVSTWVWSEAAQRQGGTIGQTQQALLDIINDAKARAATESDFVNFRNIVTDPFWNGILVLNCGVKADQLPEELKGLAAGIDPELFYGHHVGVSVTPILTDSGSLEIQQSSVFGLINFSDPDDQFYQGVPYAFKVLSLKVLFRNSAISNFFSQAEIMISELFGERSTLSDQSRGNNLILNGLYQKLDGKESYTFLVDGDSLFLMEGHVFENVEVSHAEFVTLVPPAGAADPTVHTQFILNGRLRYKALDNFDCLSFGSSVDGSGKPVDGWLAFRNLLINMEFVQGSTEQAFSFVADKIFFDVFNSSPRPMSFYNHFPLQLASLVQGDQRQLPGDMGFMSVSTPLQQGGFSGVWFGFVYNLDLGTLGSLTSNIGLTVELLVSWAPSAENYNVYVGLRLPGSSSASAEIPIEGILKLVFKKIEITAKAGAVAPAMNYMLKFRGISLSLLSLRFPPGAIDMYIFGNPESDRSAVGWYAAYSKDKEAKKDDTKLLKPKIT